ncbi:hypothetical protein HPB50_004530 [Hyalomma asiaticum]|uniref:Uncharacterized protein n=1 Tax=Hyalomma asiaticum TaxID=266040 RepID=A0ACB7S092_HYAAI|nr:hypothetical protein HPB50_004530 [Hyalomma asiaticum]
MAREKLKRLQSIPDMEERRWLVDESSHGVLGATLRKSTSTPAQRPSSASVRPATDDNDSCVPPGVEQETEKEGSPTSSAGVVFTAAQLRFPFSKFTPAQSTWSHVNRVYAILSALSLPRFQRGHKLQLNSYGLLPIPASSFRTFDYFVFCLQAFLNAVALQEKRSTKANLKP